MRGECHGSPGGNEKRDVRIRYGIRHQGTIALEEIDNALDSGRRRRIPDRDHRCPIGPTRCLCNSVHDRKHLRSRHTAGKLRRMNVDVRGIRRRDQRVERRQSNGA